MLRGVSGGFEGNELRELLDSVSLDGDPLEAQFVEPVWRIFRKSDGPQRCPSQRAVYDAIWKSGRINPPESASPA